MKRAALLVLLAPAAALAEGPTLVHTLSHYERAPDRAELEALGVPLPGALVSLVTDEGAPRIVRVRAAAALAWYPGPEVLETVRGHLAQRADEDLAVTSALLRLLASTFAHRHAFEVLETVTPLAVHADPGVRMRVIDVLRAVRTDAGARPEADALLLQMALAERNPGVRRYLTATSTR